MTNQEEYIYRMLNENNENKKNAKEFNTLMRNVHKKRLENGN
jgi:hypothetical protein